MDHKAIALACMNSRCESDIVIRNGKMKFFFFPFICFAHQTFPIHFACLHHAGSDVFIAIIRLQAEYFYKCPGIFWKKQPRMDDPGIIENYKRTGRNILTDIFINILADIAFVVHQQF
jgi:hypothetical protein